MIPDDNPGEGLYMTLKDIRRILTDCYGKEHDTPMPEHEIDQVITALRNGLGVTLCQVGMYIVPEGGPGLYCAYGRKVQDDE
jgi:hypothetical protein